MNSPHRFFKPAARGLVLFLGAAGTAGCSHREAGARSPGTSAVRLPDTTVVFGQAAPPFASPPVLNGTPDVAALVEKTKGAVVNITTSSRARGPNTMIDPFEFFFRQPFGGVGPPPGFAPNERRPSVQRRALGSGFVIDKSGYVVTNDHVVDGADDITVKLSDGREFKAKVAGRDPKLDVSLLKLDGAADLPTVVLGDSDRLRVGEYVVASGNPFGLGQTVTMGIASAKDRTIGAGPYDDFIQTDASINPGNSGGPLFNLQGEVVGMNTAIHAQGQGIGFAIPSNLMKDAIAQLRATGHVSRGRLGLVFQPVTEEIARSMGQKSSVGALVSDVEAGGPADKAGIKTGDLITRIDGEEVKDGLQLPRFVARHAPGVTVPVTLLRAGKERTLNVSLGALQPDSADSDGASATRGASGRPKNYGLTMQTGKTGVRVVGVAGAVQTLEPGDVILSVDGKVVTLPEQVTAALGAATREKRPALLRIKREDHVLFTTLDVSQP
jgi:serine protease Do